jgi:3',5'-cyclic AMP phosphodiesterase CpdA
MKFVHAADPHIDSPMKGLSAYPGAPVEAMRGATRQAFESLVDLCVAERADLLLLAGDVNVAPIASQRAPRGWGRRPRAIDVRASCC